jgi:pimeloyl-ACP methyl ester carboxylesterase
VDPRLVEAMIEQARKRIDMEGSTPAFLEAARSIFRAQAMPARYRALVARAMTPALVIHGDRDQLVPMASAVEAARSHGNWTLEILDGLGHIPQMEAPDRWLSAVEAWLDRAPLDAGEDAAERPA